MGCVQSVPTEYEHNQDTPSSPQAAPKIIAATPEPSATPFDNHAYQKVLSSPGQLEVPESFQSWFPISHAHKHVNKLFKYRQELGNGVTGSVHEVEYKMQVCAVKKVEKNDQWGRMLFTTEARVLSKIKHKGIIKYIDMFFDESYYYLLLEKADYDLYYVMNNKGYLSERKIQNIVYALLKAVAYLHAKNLAHRDLKPENIVFLSSETNHPRIIDFGDAAIAKDKKVYTEFVGTPPYMSPERLGEHNGYQLKKSDIWAIGVIAYEMFTGQRCFGGETQQEIFGKILRGEWSWPMDQVPSEAMQDFVEQCLQNDADDRLSAKDALLHAWFEAQRKAETPATPATPGRPCMKLSDVSSMNLTDAAGENTTRTTKGTGLYSIFEDLASMVEHNALQQILVQGYVQKLGDSDLDEYKQQFDKLDSDEDGFVTGPDLVTTFTSTGIGPNEASSLASIVMDKMDCNESNKIPFHKFVESKLKFTLSRNSLHAFKDILTASSGNLRGSAPNANSSGSLISCDDIVAFQKQQNQSPIPEEQLKEIFSEFDKDGDGHLSYADFVSVVKTRRVVSGGEMDVIGTDVTVQ
eukprot:CAMPEP_0197032064 /NCGR_PEP_ID=MMETSP1384-20130603/10832_1 /TAXON_ID=29189 /ORGANISM="Ammonia sp." /LENGTH=578 /DNA_ID=CAMNT_0042461663 /DNA_START=38 /DNA_END=1774 /DNA_ORIENTATION=+